MKYINKIKKKIPIFAYLCYKNEIVLHTSVCNLEVSVYFLKHHINYQSKILSCISGLDNLCLKYRFTVIYDFLSLTFNNRIRLKIHLNEITNINSIIHIFINANWWEREIWDLYGLYFKNHLDLRRILTDYGFEGYPMRKDFPVSGFIELHYTFTKKIVKILETEFAQAFRFYTFETPWISKE